VTVFDIETDGLLEEATKIHVLSWMDENGVVQHTHDPFMMAVFFTQAKTLVGHNIIRFDIPVVEKLLGIKVKAKLVDTLALSWYLNHDRPRHGLEGYGEDYGVPKPKITDWNNLTPEEYAHRCNEDVKINAKLYKDLSAQLEWLYQDQTVRESFVQYLSFKMDCARQQEALGWKLDVAKAQSHYEELQSLKEEKIEQLAEAMPKNMIYKKVEKPSRMTKADGSLTVYGERWHALLRAGGHPSTTVGPIQVLDKEERANPNSNNQVKEWLQALGWQPATFKYTVKRVLDQETGLTEKVEHQIEQVRDGAELCESVKLLIDKNPSVGILDGLSVINHRLGVFKGFLDCHKDGWLKAEIAGFTNTLRFKHYKPLVNLPGVDKPWGAEIRGCLTAPEGFVLCGADMTSLEDTTKRHYMQPLDPEYVAEMSREGFDPHLDLAKHAGAITQADIDKHNLGEVNLKALRKNYKVVNYSATYGVGATKLSRTTGLSVKESKKLLNAFWDRNWAIPKLADSMYPREKNGKKWLKNPVSGYYHSLRSDKDKFSTLNQSTGVFCFDNWVALCRRNGVQTIGQFHDEIIALVADGQQEQTKQLMEKAIATLNDKLKLNVPLGVDAQFGTNYAEIH